MIAIIQRASAFLISGFRFKVSGFFFLLPAPTASRSNQNPEI